jgi:ketosteroid isomerase-like protein
MSGSRSAAAELVGNFYEYASKHDFAGATALFADDIEIQVFGPASIPFAGRYHGREAAVQFYSNVGRLLQVERFEPLEFIAQGSRVVVIGRERSVVRATNKTFDIGWVQVWTVAAQRIARLRGYFDTGTMALAFT